MAQKDARGDHRRGQLRTHSLVGVQFYKNAKKDDIIQTSCTQLADYHVKDIEFTLGMDVNVTKVGKDLSEGNLRRAEQHL